MTFPLFYMICFIIWKSIKYRIYFIEYLGIIRKYKMQMSAQAKSAFKNPGNKN